MTLVKDRHFLEHAQDRQSRFCCFVGRFFPHIHVTRVYFAV